MLIHLWLATRCTLHGHTDSRVCPVAAVLAYIAVKSQVPGLQFMHRNECQLYGLTFQNSSHWQWLNLPHFTWHSFWIEATSSTGQDWSLVVSNPDPQPIAIICISTVGLNANSNTPRCVLDAGPSPYQSKKADIIVVLLSDSNCCFMWFTVFSLSPWFLSHPHVMAILYCSAQEADKLFSQQVGTRIEISHTWNFEWWVTYRLQQLEKSWYSYTHLASPPHTVSRWVVHSKS